MCRHDTASKPCPFCGGTKGHQRSNGQWWCFTCGAEGPDMRANYTWDSRPREEALEDLLLEMNEAADMRESEVS